MFGSSDGIMVMPSSSELFINGWIKIRLSYNIKEVET